MRALYLLALLLTGDETMAEQCFVAGLDQCIEGNAAFRKWARDWSKRVIIKNAIRLASPTPNCAPPMAATRIADALPYPLKAVLRQYSSFDRFVFVMSVLEAYTDRDCAILLHCSVADVVNARTRVFHQLQNSADLEMSAEAGRSA